MAQAGGNRLKRVVSGTKKGQDQMGQTLALARPACALALAAILAISTPIDALAASGPSNITGGGLLSR